MSKWTKIKNIKGCVKKYSDTLMKKYDEPIRNKLKNILGNFIKDNPDIYQQDFIITNSKCRYKYLEVQICSRWINDYPYDKLFVYARKLKYSDDTLFLTVSKNLMYGYVFRQIDIDKKPKRFKKYSREYIYNIPWNKTFKVNINYLDELFFLMI